MILGPIFEKLWLNLAWSRTKNLRVNLSHKNEYSLLSCTCVRKFSIAPKSTISTYEAISIKILKKLRVVKSLCLDCVIMYLGKTNFCLVVLDDPQTPLCPNIFLTKVQRHMLEKNFFLLYTNIMDKNSFYRLQVRLSQVSLG